MNTTDYQHMLMHKARAKEIHRNRAQWRLAVEATAGQGDSVARPVREVSFAALLRLFLRRRVTSRGVTTRVVSGTRHFSEAADQPAVPVPNSYPSGRAACAIVVEV